MDFMDEAYKQAVLAFKNDEVPVGCVIVKDDQIIASSCNNKEKSNCITGHAEINALLQASKILNNYRLDGCDLYVTLEPCIMCASAIQQAHINKVYFGAKDEKNGGVCSLIHTFDLQGLNHFVKYEYQENEACKQILKEYFLLKRLK